MPLDPGRVRPRERRPWWVAITITGLSLGLIAGAVAASVSPLAAVDSAVADEAYDSVHGNGGLVTALRVIAFVGAPALLRVLLLFVAVWLAVRGAWRLSLWLALSTLVEWAVAPLTKRVFDRPRPSWDAPIVDVAGLSFPSGHAAGAGMFAAAAVLLTLMGLQRGRTRTTLCWLWVAIGTVVGLDRIFLGVHYLSDVVAGWLFGALIVVVGWQLVVRPGIAVLAVVNGTPGSRPARFAVVANPLRVPDMDAFRASVTAVGARWGWEAPLWLETEADDLGVGMSEQALLADVQMVLAAGGDGTVRVVCSELARTGVAVGLVPLGTGNLLVRNLGLPLHTGDALETALSGRDRYVDIVKVDGDDMAETSFTVMAGLGFDAAIMAGAPDELKARMGWPAYVVSALRQLRHPATWVEVSVDNAEPVRRRVRTVVVGNVGLLQAGIPLLPDALIDDGRLDVVMIAPRHTVGWLRLVVRVLRRARRTDERLDRMTGRRVVIRADKPLLRQLDGDPIGEGYELRAEVLPGALLVRVAR